MSEARSLIFVCFCWGPFGHRLAVVVCGTDEHRPSLGPGMRFPRARYRTCRFPLAHHLSHLHACILALAAMCTFPALAMQHACVQLATLSQTTSCGLQGLTSSKISVLKADHAPVFNVCMRGDIVASAEDSRVRIWDLRSRRCVMFFFCFFLAKVVLTCIKVAIVPLSGIFSLSLDVIFPT